MDTVRPLLFGTESDGSLQTNNSRLALLLASVSNSIVDAGQIGIAIIDVKNLPIIGEETLFYALGEGNLST
jgi:hypothetical protein